MNLESACKLWSKLQCYNACTSSGENNSRWFDGAQLTVTYEIDRDMFTFESYCICTRERQKRSGEQMKFYYPTSDLTKWCNVYNLEGWWWGSCDFLFFSVLFVLPWVFLFLLEVFYQKALHIPPLGLLCMTSFFSAAFVFLIILTIMMFPGWP